MLQRNDLFDYKNRYIYQDSEFFKFSLDSILLAEFVEKKLKSNQLILDMCSGNMAVPLILSTYLSNRIVGFEIQQKIYDLALMSIRENGLDNQLEIINDDIKNIRNYFKSESFDVIVCNPPFFKVNDLKVLNHNMELSIARHEVSLKLEDIFVVAKTFLKNNGVLYLVHRSQRIDEIIRYASLYNVGVKKIQFVRTKNTCDPEIVLVKCVKNSKNGVKITKEISVDGLKTYQCLFEGR